MSRFRGVWATPQVPLVVIASLVARLPYGINALAIVLFVQERTGSFARAGVVSAAYGLGAGVGLPVFGRVVDRVGQTRVLVATSCVHGCGVALLVGLGLAGAPTGALALAAAVAGVAVPPISPCVRGIFDELLSSRGRRCAPRWLWTRSSWRSSTSAGPC